MATSKYRKAEERRIRIKKALDEIAAHRAKQRREEYKKSYPMHTPKEALKELGERSRKRT